MQKVHLSLFQALAFHLKIFNHKAQTYYEPSFFEHKTYWDTLSLEPRAHLQWLKAQTQVFKADTKLFTPPIFRWI